MAKQTFTTGQVLTAAEMTSLQQTAMGGGSTTAKTTSYVLVAADAGTVVQMNSASATTITVNTALFAAGDTVQIQNVGAGVCTVTAGTATVSTAGSLALSQYEGGQLYFNSTSAALFFDIVQTSGMTNPMTTTGDIIYSSSGSTPARLGIGTTGQVVTVAAGIPSWATPSGGGTPFATDILVNSIIVGRSAGDISTNTVVGNAALDSNTTGSNIVAMGVNALTANTTGAQNIAVGANAITANTTGSENTAVGHNALKTGTGNASCTAIGWGSLEVCSAGDKNTGVGYNSLYQVTTGTRNTGMGGRTGISLTTGSTNTILGEAAGQTLATGSNNTLIGCGSATASSSSSNSVTFGDASIATLRAQVTSITALSDARDKKNVEPLQVGLDFVNDLKPVKFDWNMRPTIDIDGNEVRGKVDVPDVGFIAQDLVAQEDASGLADYLQLTYRDNPEKLEATQGRLIPILVKAIQELSAKVAALEANA